jgi:hypothetical protein
MFFESSKMKPSVTQMIWIVIGLASVFFLAFPEQLCTFVATVLASLATVSLAKLIHDQKD